VDRLLTRAHGLFDAPAGGSGVSTGGGGRGPVPPAPAGGGGLASGVATAGGGYEQSTAGVSGLDAELAATAAEGSSVAAQGRAGAGAIRDQARTVAAALSPMSNSAAGARLIVAAMDEHLAAMQRQLDTTTEQNKVLAVRLRQLAEAYRTAGSSGIESGHDGTTAGRGVQAVGFGTGGAPPIADTGFTAPDGTRAPAEGGPLTGVLARSDLGGNGENGMTDIGLADLYAHDVAPNIATRHVLPPDKPIDRWENPGWQSPPRSSSVTPGTDPKPPSHRN
jgi:hypothetical protein